MKKIKILIAFVFAGLLLGCSEDEDSLNNLANVAAPSDISALFTITQDNSGKVTIAPSGQGVGKYEIYFGDDANEMATVLPGRTVDHIYGEGVYTVKIVGVGLNGLRTAVDQELTVTFRMPENFSFTITQVAGNAFAVNVAATADYETYFEVWFGEDPQQEPVQFMQGTPATHTYAATGTYTVTVVAYSGGAATSQMTQQVTITEPLVLPINFESLTQDYGLASFGNAQASVVNNPHLSGINTSAKVGQFVKPAGAEVWAGTTITLDSPIDFTTMNNFRVKVWSPQAGVPVLLKVENLTDGTISKEVQQVTTVANDWEYLSYNFVGISTTLEYSKISLFFNFGSVGTGATYYFDDLEQMSGINPLPLNFESGGEYVFNNFGGAVGSKVANPNPSGINTSANVGKVIKNTGAEVWGGIATPLAAPIDFAIQHKIKMKVWSPQAGIPVLLKLENLGNSSISTELSATTTVANAWEELTYDFNGINNANNYQNVVIFFDFGHTGNGATYYFDDIQLSN